MDHERLLDVPGFWNDVHEAVKALLGRTRRATSRRTCKNAAAKLLSAREVLYSGQHPLARRLAPDRGQTRRPAARGARRRHAAQPDGHRPHPGAAGRASTRSGSPSCKAKLDEAIQPPVLEMIGGVYREREDALLPVESQLWNLRKGRATARDVVGATGRGAAPGSGRPTTRSVPAWVQATGLRRAVLRRFDGAVDPEPPGHGGQLVEPGRQGDRRLHPRAGPGPQGRDVLQPRLHTCTSRSPRTRPRPSPSSTRASRPNPLYERLAGPEQARPGARRVDDVLAVFQRRPGRRVHRHGQPGRLLRRLPRGADQRPPAGPGERVRPCRLRPAAGSTPPGRSPPCTARSAAAGPTDERERPSSTSCTSAEDADETRGWSRDPRRRAASGVAARQTPLGQETRRPPPGPGRATTSRGFLLLNPCAFTRRVALELDGMPRPVADRRADQGRPVRRRQGAAGGRGPAARVRVGPGQGPAGTPAPKPRVRMADGQHGPQRVLRGRDRPGHRRAARRSATPGRA